MTAPPSLQAHAPASPNFLARQPASTVPQQGAFRRRGFHRSDEALSLISLKSEARAGQCPRDREVEHGTFAPLGNVVRVPSPAVTYRK
jgi:hypothetical protein